MPGSEPGPRSEPDLTLAPSWAEPALEVDFFPLSFYGLSVFIASVMTGKQRSPTALGARGGSPERPGVSHT